MNALLAGLVKLFLAVASVSWQASILVFLVLAAQLLLGRKLPLRWRHALWLLVLARLVLPELPASPFSFYRVAGPAPKLESLTGDAAGGSASAQSDAASSAVGAGKHDSGWIVRGVQLATVVWLLGMFVLAAMIIGANRRFVRRLKSSQRPPGAEILQLARACAEELRIRRSFSVVETGLVATPALFGLWRPKLLLPIDPDSALSPAELRLVVLHELAHLQRADLYCHALLSVLQAVHWFNPILWFAFARMRDDSEMATDALVLSGPRAALKTQYGHTLLKLIENAQNHSPSLQLVGILENPGELKNRLRRIRQATPEGYRWSKSGLALASLLSALFLTRAYADANTVIVHAKVADQRWNGWGLSSPVDSPAPVLPPEEFSLVQNPAAPRVFSGHVVAPGSLDGVEVGLVSLVGVHWVNPNAYQWQPVKADGSFSLTDARYLDAYKALVVRGPHVPWTFFRYNFGPHESATGIVLRAAEPRTIQLSVSGEDGRDLDHSSFELFPAHAEYDDLGGVLRRQRLGEFKSGGNTIAQIVAPSGEVAVFAHHDGYASYYQVIDTRQSGQFRFVLRPPGRMKITVLDRDGDPEGGVPIRWANPDAPLSLSRSATNGNGVLAQDDLSPGIFELEVKGFALRKITVAERQLTEITLREGMDP